MKKATIKKEVKIKKVKISSCPLDALTGSWDDK